MKITSVVSVLTAVVLAMVVDADEERNPGIMQLRGGSDHQDSSQFRRKLRIQSWESYATRNDPITDGCYNLVQPNQELFTPSFLVPQGALSQEKCDQLCSNKGYRMSVRMDLPHQVAGVPMSVDVEPLCLCTSIGLRKGATPTTCTGTNNKIGPFYKIKEVNPKMTRSVPYSGTPIADLGGCFFIDYISAPAGLSVDYTLMILNGNSDDTQCQSQCYDYGFKYSWHNTRAEDPEFKNLCHCLMIPPTLIPNQSNCPGDSRIFQLWEKEPMPTATTTEEAAVHTENTLTYTAQNTKTGLCSDGINAIATEYSGHVCRTDPDGTEHIRWMSMKTVQPTLPYVQASQCKWDSTNWRHWINEWAGHCGSPPTQFPNMPTTKAALLAA